MFGRLCYIGVLVVVLMAVAVRAAIPGPNDPRYPDNIVVPRVKCVKEGSFPHPRNCSWYYRCVDRMNVGYFWTYYFECEPGTVFSDDLDQCVHPSSVADGPCAGVKPTTSGPPLPCKGVPGTCKTYEICRPKRMQKLMCEKIHCPVRNPNLQCSAGYFYDMTERICARPPAEEDLCGAVTPPINITQKGELACSYDNLRPSSDFISRLYCDTFILCDGDNFKGKTELCRSYYECYKDGYMWKAARRSCPSELLYSYELDKCLPSPTEAEKCKPSQL